MNFLNFVIFVSLLIVNVQSSSFNQSWNDLLRSKKTDKNTNKGYIGMTYSLLPTGVGLTLRLTQCTIKFHKYNINSSKQNDRLGDIIAEQLIL